MLIFTVQIDIEIGFFQDSYTVMEGETVTVVFGILSDVSEVTNSDFASLDISIIDGSATGK